MTYKMMTAYWLTCFMIGIELLFMTRMVIITTHHQGEYSELTRTYWCMNASACRHESAHAMDQALGWQSLTPAYYWSLVKFSQGTGTWERVTAMELAENHPLKEIYAEMYQAAGSEEGMPEIFRKFYQWN